MKYLMEVWSAPLSRGKLLGMLELEVPVFGNGLAFFQGRKRTTLGLGHRKINPTDTRTVLVATKKALAVVEKLPQWRSA